MTTRKTGWLLPVILVIFCHCNFSDDENFQPGNICIELELKGNQSESISEFKYLGHLPVKRFQAEYVWTPARGKVSNRTIKWKLNSLEPLVVKTSAGLLHAVSPGDSIHISYDGRNIAWSGKGYEKLSMWKELQAAGETLTTPTKNSYKIYSVEDYRKWNSYLDQKTALQIPIIESYKHKIQLDEYDYLKSLVINNNETDRIHAFIALQKHLEKNGKWPDIGNTLNSIWDSTQYKYWGNWLRSLSKYTGDILYIYTFNRIEIHRRFGFNPTNDSLSSKDIRLYLAYESAGIKYKGLTRERLLAYIVDEKTIKEVGLKNVVAQKILSDYYQQPGYPEYKNYIKGLVAKAK